MATKKGNRTSEEYNVAPIIPGNKKVWFLNKDLVRIVHYNRSNGNVRYIYRNGGRYKKT